MPELVARPYSILGRTAHKARKFGIIGGMEKCFNIAGPCFPDEHYMLPALERLPGIMRIVEQRSYVVLHAARQSGKTTAARRRR